MDRASEMFEAVICDVCHQLTFNLPLAELELCRALGERGVCRIDASSWIVKQQVQNSDVT